MKIILHAIFLCLCIPACASQQIKKTVTQILKSPRTHVMVGMPLISRLVLSPVTQWLQKNTPLKMKPKDRVCVGTHYAMLLAPYGYLTKTTKYSFLEKCGDMVLLDTLCAAAHHTTGECLCGKSTQRHRNHTTGLFLYSLCAVPFYLVSFLNKKYTWF